MTAIAGGIPLNHPGLTPIDQSKLKRFQMHEAPEDMYRRFVESQEAFLKLRHSQSADTSGNPAYAKFATVQVDGKTVAEIDNNGFATMSNALASKIGSALPGMIGGKTGPMLAQARAELIARSLGGEVVKSSTAMSQRQYDAVERPRATLDEQAMQQDPAYLQLLKIKEARTLFLAQQMAQSPPGA